MIIFLYGQDTYRLQQKLNEIINHYKKIHQTGLNLKYYHLPKVDFQEFIEELLQTPIFQEKKLLILADVFSSPEFSEKVLENQQILTNSKDIILFYQKGKVDHKNFLFKFLLKYATFQEFEFLEGEKLKNWLRKEITNLGGKISPKALAKLIDFVGNDSWQLISEIKKLVNYKNNETIESEDIELLVRPEIENDIFKTIDAIAFKNKREALILLQRHLEKGDSPLYLLSMISFQFRNLLMIKSHQLGDQLYANDMRILSERLKIHPYVIRKTIQQTKKFTLEELKKIYQKIFETDLAIKTGKIEPETALPLLIAEI